MTSAAAEVFTDWAVFQVIAIGAPMFIGWGIVRSVRYRYNGN